MRAAQSVSGYEELARYQLLVDSITDYAIFMLDAEGIVATWNPGVMESTSSW